MGQGPGRIIYDNLTSLAREAVRRQYVAEKGIWQKYGASGRQKALEDARYHLVFLAEALLAEEPVLFIEYINWLKVLFKGLGFAGTSLIIAIDCTFEVVAAKIPPESRRLLEFYRAQAMHSLDSEPRSGSFITGKGILPRLAARYLDLLLKRDRQAALALIMETVESGTPVNDIYLGIFQPVQREAGYRWQTGALNVAEEHYITAATQLIMSQLYPKIFATPRRGYRLLATTVGGEYHEMGIRMVADLFELNGWDTYFLGASTPAGAITLAVRDWKPDVVAISATMTFNVSQVAGLIGAVRQSGTGHKPGIIVGGLPFNIAAGLWQKLGADGFAADGRQAVILAEQLAIKAGKAV